MPKLVNLETNTLEELNYDQMGAALQSGKYGFIKGQPVNLISPNQEPVQLDPEHVFKALQEGYQIPTQKTVGAQLHDQAMDEKYGQGAANQAKAFAAGALRSASFGLSDQALTRSGLASPEALRELESRNPASSIAGETAGIVGSLLGGEEGAAVNLPKTVGRLGEAITAGIAGEKAGTAAGRVLQSVGSRAVGSAAEGALYGAGQAVSEQALGDPDLNAQKVLATIGNGALFGAGVGALAGTIPPSLEAAKAGLGMVKESFPGIAAKVSGKSLDDIVNVMQNAGAGITEEGLNSAVGDFQKAFTQQDKLMQKAASDVFKEAKPAKLAQMIGDEYLGPAKAQLKDTVLKANAIATELEENGARHLSGYGNKIQELASYLERDAKGDDAAQIFKALDKFKQDLQKEVKFDVLNKTPQRMATENLINDLRSSVKAGLEDQAAWGPAAAKYASLNSAFSEYKSIRDQIVKDLGVKRLTEDLKKGIVFKESKIASALKDPIKLQAMGQLQQASKRLLGEVEEMYTALPKEQQFDRKAVDSLLEKNDKLKLAMQNQKSFLDAQSRLAGSSVDNYGAAVIGGLAGHVLGPVGAAGAAIYGALKNPGTTIKVMSKIERAINKFNNRLVSVSDSVFKPSKADVTKPIMDAQEFTKTKMMLGQYSQNPRALIDKIGNQVKHLATFLPNTADALTIHSTNGAQFLASKLPQDQAQAPLDAKMPLSSTDISHFNAYYQIVKDPLHALEQVKAGTLRPETIETLKSVYPKLYMDMQQQLTKSLMSAQAKGITIPYKNKMMLSMFLGQDLDSSLSPTSIQDNQRYLSPVQQAQEAKQAGMGQPTQGGLKQLDRADSALTPMQSAIYRKE